MTNFLLFLPRLPAHRVAMIGCTAESATGHFGGLVQTRLGSQYEWRPQQPVHLSRTWGLFVSTTPDILAVPVLAHFSVSSRTSSLQSLRYALPATCAGALALSMIYVSSIFDKSHLPAFRHCDISSAPLIGPRVVRDADQFIKNCRRDTGRWLGAHHRIQQSAAEH